MEKIDFVGIGAPKCGTTWVSTQLSCHPEIGFASAKETYFFADTIARRMAGEELRCYDRGIEWYHGQFPPLGDGVRVRGEFCPSYLYSPEAAERLASYAPNVKLLICLRPPVEMIYSWYWYNRNGVVAPLPPTFEAAMELPLVRDLGRHAFHLRPYLERFEAGNILAVEFSAIRNDPARVRREVYEFLGVDARHVPAPGGESRNSARGSRFAWLQTASKGVHARLKNAPLVSSLLQSPRVAQFLEQAYHRVNSRALKYPAITEEARARWTEYYAEDQRELERLLQDVRKVRDARPRPAPEAILGIPQAA